MTLKYWLLYILSAILYAAPLLFSTYLWPLVFLFPVPLLYITQYTHFSFGYGLLWGIIAFSAHLSGVLWGLNNLAQGTILARFAPTFALVLSASLYSMLWFGFNNKIIQYFHVRTIKQKLILWVITYWIFLITMEKYCFVIFGRIGEGHFAFNPFFVLAEQPRLLALLPYLSSATLTLLAMCFSGSLVYAYIQKTTRSFVWVLIFTLPWLISLAIPLPTLEKPEWLSKIAYLPVKITSTMNLTKQASIAKDLFQHIANLHPHAQLIIMPESAIFCDHLSQAPELCSQWSEKELGRPLHIVLGSFRWDGPYYRNTLHWIFNGKLEKIFDKRHAMLLTETIPFIYKVKLFEELFFKTFPGITPSTVERPLLSILNGVSFIPYICSELFFNDKPDDAYAKGSTILAITNDMWSHGTNVPKLMYLSARFRAIQWQRNVLYISYSYASYFDMFGNEINLTLGN